MKGSFILCFSLIFFFAWIFSCKDDSPGTRSGDLNDGGAGNGNTQVEDPHSSRRALDWDGTYSGVLPCADCAGIDTRITLLDNGSFNRIATYLGKDENNQSVSRGAFTWDKDGQVITTTDQNGNVQKYFVGENMLYHLDQEGNRIEGSLEARYKLARITSDEAIEYTQWVIEALMGEPYSSDNVDFQPYFELDRESARISGHNGCYVFTGQYKLQEGGRIMFGQLAGTMQLCKDMRTPAKFMESLKEVDQYTIKDDILILSKEGYGQLATFRSAQD